MRLHVIERLRRALRPAPHVVMKAREFDWPTDDLGQVIPDVEARVKPPARRAEFPDDEIEAHAETMPN